MKSFAFPALLSLVLTMSLTVSPVSSMEYETSGKVRLWSQLSNNLPDLLDASSNAVFTKFGSSNRCPVTGRASSRLLEYQLDSNTMVEFVTEDGFVTSFFIRNARPSYFALPGSEVDGNSLMPSADSGADAKGGNLDPQLPKVWQELSKSLDKLFNSPLEKFSTLSCELNGMKNVSTGNSSTGDYSATFEIEEGHQLVIGFSCGKIEQISFHSSKKHPKLFSIEPVVNDESRRSEGSRSR